MFINCKGEGASKDLSNRKAFTLIELLAVIVILAIISLIATPIILNIVETARKGAVLRSAESIVKASDLYHMSSQLGMESLDTITFNCDKNECKSLKVDEKGNPIKLDVSGNVGIGTVTIDIDGNVSIKIENNGYCVYKYASNNKINILKGTCESVDVVDDTIAPIITLKENYPIVTSNSVIIGYNIEENESGIKSVTCKYGEDKNNLDKEVNNASISECVIKNLQSASHIYYEVCAVDNGENETNPCLTGDVETRTIEKPNIELTGTPNTSQNDYLKEEVAKVTFNKEGISNPEYYIYTSKEGTVTTEVIKCEKKEEGEPGKPGTCNENTTNLEANTWYKVSGDIEVTYSGNQDTGYIYAVIYDGTSFGGISSATLHKTEANKPVLDLIETTSTTNAITIKFTADDSESGIDEDSFECTIGGKAGTTNNIDGNNYSCIATGITSKESQSYSINASDKVGNISDVLTGEATINDIIIPVITWQGYNYAGTTNISMDGYLYSDEVTVTFDDTGIEKAEHYIKTSVNTSVSLNAINCGTGEEPVCQGSSENLTTLLANTWYQVIDNKIVITFNEQGSIDAYTYDESGNNGYASGSSRKIDQTGPTNIEVNVSNITPNSITVTATCSDMESGIEKIEISKDGGQTYETYHMVDSLWQMSEDEYYGQYNASVTKSNTYENHTLINKYIFNSISNSQQNGIWYSTPMLNLGSEYIWSLYVKTNRQVQVSIGDELSGQISKNISTDFRRYENFFIAAHNPFNQNYAFTFFGQFIENDELYVHSLSIREKGVYSKEASYEYTFNDLTDSSYDIRVRCTNNLGQIVEGDVSTYNINPETASKSYVDSINTKNNLEDNQKYFVKENSTYKSEVDTDTNIYLNDIVDISGIKANDGYILISDGKVVYGIFNFNGQEYECDSNKCEIRDKENYISSNNIVRYNYDDEANTDAILKNLAGDSTYDGQIYNATYTDDGLFFNGTNSYVAMGEFNPDHFTIEVTIKLNNITTDEQDIIANFENGGFGSYLKEKYIIFEVYIDGGYKHISSKFIPNANQIYHLTFSYDGNTIKFYINGILQGTYVSSSGIRKPDLNTWLVLGSNPSGNRAGGHWLNGSIYSVRTYDRALTDYEVNHNYMLDKNKYLVD